MVGFSGECGRRDGVTMHGEFFYGITTCEVGTTNIDAVLLSEATERLLRDITEQVGKVFMLNGIDWNNDTKQVVVHFVPGNGVVKVIQPCDEFRETEDGDVR